MRFSLLALISCSLVVLAACEKPCPKGQQRYGVKCVMSPVHDAGLDGFDAASESELGDGGAGESTMDGGEPMSCVPPTCHPCESTPCGKGGICSETDMGFECTCKVGFSGKKCDVDVCDLSPCVHGECVRTAVGRTCECDASYVGDTCDKNTDATLADLTVSAGTLFPSFKPDVLAYSVDLGISSPEVSVVATASAVDGAAIKIEGVAVQSGSARAPYALELNTARVVHVDILADDGTKVEYEITLRRRGVPASGAASVPHEDGSLPRQHACARLAGVGDNPMHTCSTLPMDRGLRRAHPACLGPRTLQRPLMQSSLG